MKETQQEKLSIQLNAEETHKGNSSIIEREHIGGTPFWQIGTEEGYFLVMGDYRITDIMPAKIDAIEYLIENEWTIIMHLVIILAERIVKEQLVQKEG